jgi:hypothetical protein
MSTFEESLRELLAAGNSVRFQARGDSMHPTIRDGEHLIVVPCDAGGVCRGDIVLTRLRRGLTAHRVVRVMRSGSVEITTRGDNAITCDEAAGPGQLMGRVAAVEKDGVAKYFELPSKSAMFVRFAAATLRWVRERLRFVTVR